MICDFNIYFGSQSKLENDPGPLPQLVNLIEKSVMNSNIKS